AAANRAALARTVVAAGACAGPDPGRLWPGYLGNARHAAATRGHLRGSGRCLCPRARRPTSGWLGRAPLPLTTAGPSHVTRGGFQALFPQDRSDRGCSRVISAEIAEQILRVKRERPRRSIRRIIRMLERAQIVPRGTLHRSTVHRLLLAHRLSARPQRHGVTERRSFLPEHAGDLWVGDSLHGPLVIAADGSLRKAYLLSPIDGATRYVPHSYFALSATAVDQES